MAERRRLFALLLSLAVIASVLSFGVVGPRPTCSFVYKNGDLVAEYRDVPCSDVAQLRARLESRS